MRLSDGQLQVDLSGAMQQDGRKDTIALSCEDGPKKLSPLQVLLQIKHRVKDVKTHPYQVAEAHFRSK